MASVAANIDLEIGDQVAQFYADPFGFVMFAWPWGEAAMTDHMRQRLLHLAPSLHQQVPAPLANT